MAERPTLHRRQRPDPLTPDERAEYNGLSERRFNISDPTPATVERVGPVEAKKMMVLSFADRKRLDQLGEKIETATLPAQWWLKPENRHGR